MKLDDLKKQGLAPEWMTEFGYTTLSNGYLLEGEEPKDMYIRIANSVSSYLKKPELSSKFFEIMWKGWLCPSTPVLTNSGTSRGLPISCYASEIPDSIDGIMMGMHEIAMLSKNGGGIGTHWSSVRPRGSKVKGNGTTEGIIPFLKILDSTTVGISQGGCYEEGTSVLTSEGFVDFRNLTEDHLIAQLTAEGDLSWTKGEPTIRPWSGKMIRITHPSGLDLVVTPNHRMMVDRVSRINKKKSWNKQLQEISAEDVKFHRDLRMHVASFSDVNSTEEISNLERFLIAFQADGRKTDVRDNNDLFRVYFRFTKDRKIERLRNILNDCNLNFSENKDKTGVTLFSVEVSKEFFKPDFSWVEVSSFTKSKARSFIEELSHWDATVYNNKNSLKYSSTVFLNVLKVEALCVVAGYRSKVTYSRLQDEVRSPISYIYIQKTYRGLSGDEIKKSEVSYEGNVYCCIVPEGRIVVKDRNGFVSVCGNTRRGSTACYLDITHGDFSEFLNMRRPQGDVNRQLLNLHHSANIGSDFMNDVLSNKGSARHTWKEYLKTRFETGEPYSFFSDNVEKNKPESYKKLGLKINGSNLCNEIYLHTSEEYTFVCCLSSLNLAKWDEWKDSDVVELSIMFLDGVMEEFITKAKSKPGFSKAVAFAEKSRALGLGVLGFHTLLQQKNLAYSDLQTKILNNLIFKTIRDKADKATEYLAKEYGEPDWCKGFGRRNTHCLALAPTVSNSLISGDISPSIEPWSSNSFVQKSAKGTFFRKNSLLEKLLDSKGKNTLEVWKSISENEGSVAHLDFLDQHEKQVFATAREMNMFDLVKLAGDRQKYIDQGQSLNLFFPSNTDPKYFNQVHIMAWELGLNGLYYCRTSSVLKGDIGSKGHSDMYKRELSECTWCEG